MRSTLMLVTKSLIATALFVGLAWWIQQQFGWKSVLSDWSQVSVPTAIIAAILVFCSHFLRIYRISFAYSVKQPTPWHTVAGVSLVHNTLSFLLPMRLGEAALPLLSRHQLQMDIRYATASLILVRLFDLHVLAMLLLSFTGSLWLGEKALMITIATLFAFPVAIHVLKHLCSRLQPLAAASPLLEKKRTWLLLYAQTLAIWLIKLAALSYIACVLGQLAIDHAWIATIIADGSALSPVTGFANAGTFEAAFSLPLLPLGYSSDTLLKTAVNVHLFIFATNIIAGIIGVLLLNKRANTH